MEKECIFGGYRLAVDAEKTRAYYAAHPLPWVTCTCGGCRNFTQAVKLLPADVQRFFAQLGIDPEKPAETCWYPGTQTVSNGDAWYHLCGRIVERIEPPENHIWGEWLDIAEKFRAAFQPECALVPEDFPQPCFQMDVSFQLPWVLDETNPDINPDIELH